MHANAVPVPVGIWRRNDRLHRNIRQPADAPQSLLHLPGLDGELRFVSELPVNTSATVRKVRALGLNSFARGNQDLATLAFGEALLLPGELNCHGVTGSSERYKNDLATEPAHPFAAKRNVLDLD